MTAAAHDAGGKGRLPLLPGVIGRAVFCGARVEHRLTLERAWGDNLADIDALPFALWVGMNPSTAMADEDDLTVRKEQQWTRQLDLCRYMKVNIGSWRSTDPAGLSAPGVEISHPDNLAMIRLHAHAARIIVIACGTPPPVLLPIARTVMRTLKQDGRTLHCLGLTREGWPRHSSRLAYATPMEVFRP